jgi:hypothetical protein
MMILRMSFPASPGQFIIKAALLVIVIFGGNSGCFGQSVTKIKGRVTDAETGEPVPFANIYFHRDISGTITDFDGFYSIITSYDEDSIEVSYVGYKTQKSPIKRGVIQTIDFRLEADVINLKELNIYAGENPSWEIIRNVIKNKNTNDKRALDAYDCDSYNRIEIDVNRIPDKYKSIGAINRITSTLDSVYKLRDDNGQQLIPLFISENYSRYYVKNNPLITKEVIKKTRIEGVGIEDGAYVSQFLGSSFQEYNFYRNWLNIFEKEFISPIADGWRIYYDYYILDSLVIDKDSCFLLSIEPKNEKDLAFSGKMWITKKDYALKQIDVTISKSANLNFIRSIRIQQSLEKTSQGAWLPNKTRLTIDVTELGNKFPGFTVKFNNSINNWVLNEPRPPSFYNTPLELEPKNIEMDDNFWKSHRSDTLTLDEKMSFKLIDTLQEIPVVKRLTFLGKFAATGYIRTSKIDYGPALYTYSFNNIEGNRVRLGFRTNEYLSDRWYLRLYGAYGFKDQQFKYGFYTGFIFNRRQWTELIFGKKYDIDQVGIQSDELTENYIFLALTRFGTLSQPFFNDVTAVRFRSQFGRGFYYNLTLQRETFDPLYSFAYYTENGVPGEIAHNYINTTASFELHYARDETFVTNGNLRLSLGINRAPGFTLQYTQGLKNVLGGDFNYKKLVFTYDQNLRLGLLGTSFYRFNAARVFDPVPYPILFNHIGNETFFYTTGAYSTMNYFEFVSDSYLSLRYQHYFGGFIMNRIPLMNKLKWRLVGNANILWGHMSSASKNLIPAVDETGNPVEQFNSLGNVPYIELGYGIENIFKVIRIDAFHRITYLNNPNVHPFQVKISFQLIL